MDGTATSKGSKASKKTRKEAQGAPATPPPPDDRRQKLQKAIGWVWVLLVISLAFRLCYIALRQLVADEAVYWSWSRHLATGYLDHPPMIVYLIHLGTALFGTNEFGVRFFCPLLAAGMLALMLLLAKRVLREPRAVLWVGIIWLTSPLLAGLGTIATPDTPATFFSLCALTCVVVLFTGDNEGRPYSASAGAGLWMAFGAFCGLAFTSKYTTVLLPASVGLALLTSPEGRRQLRRPWPWLSAVPALLVFSPVILWNRAHRWASFKFQFNHGLSHAKATAAAAAAPEGGLAHLAHALLAALLGLARYVGNELLVGTPVFFVLGVVLLVVFWRRYRRLGAADRVLLWSATVPLAFFAYASLRAQSEANWPNFAYFPLSLLIVRWAAETWDAGRVGLLRTGCIVAAVGLVVLHVPEAIGAVLPGRLHAKVMAKLDEMAGGWWLLAKEVDALDPGRVIVTEKFQDAGNIGFYARGHPQAWPVGDSDPVDETKADDGKKHRRPFAFDYFDDKPDFEAVDHVLFVGYHYQHFAERYGLKMPKDGAVISTVTLPTGGTFKLSFILLDRPPAETQPAQTQPAPTR